MQDDARIGELCPNGPDPPISHRNRTIAPVSVGLAQHHNQQFIAAGYVQQIAVVVVIAVKEAAFLPAWIGSSVASKSRMISLGTALKDSRNRSGSRA